MKKILATVFALTFLAIPIAHAETSVIRITDQPHMNFDGTFRNNDLATLILPDQKLGKLVFGASPVKKTWVIDSELVDEIATMAAGYSVNGKKDENGRIAAQRWLAQLKYASANNPVMALPYGNPDESLAKHLAPSELRFYSAYGKEKLEARLGRTVSAENGWGKGVSRLSYQFKAAYSKHRQQITGLSTISTATEITDLRARLAIVMNPALNKEDRAYFSYASEIATQKALKKLRVVTGKYQLTSTTSKVPVTLVNEFDTATVVSLSLIPMNSRMQVRNQNNITLAAKSRLQLNLEVTAVAPGSTLVLAQFMNSKGQLVGERSKLNLTATIIDSRVAWFTTGAAILLFIAAVAQSVRRVRKARK
jgi:Family of unknown function (DUF6049)